MGCDIHAHIEVKVNGVWHHYSNPQIHRYYRLFARICGVRLHEGSDVVPVDKPRGIPSDVSLLTKLCYDFEDHHSATWLSKEELNFLIKWHEEALDANSPGTGYTAQHEQWGYLNGNDFMSCKECHPDEFEDCRLVCWFDN